MNYGEIWAQEPFNVVHMTREINRMEYRPNLFETWLDWEPDESPTPSFAVDIEENSVKLLPIVDRSSQLPSEQRTTRLSVTMPIPRIGSMASVEVNEVLGVRETGSINMLTLEALAAKKQKKILDNINLTTQWLMRAALDGKVVDATNNLVVFDCAKQLGVQLTVVPFDFADKTIDVNVWLGAAKRWIEDTMGDYQVQMDKLTLFCGRDFYRGLLQRPDIKEIFKDYQVKTIALRMLQADRNIPGGFVLADNVTVVDAGNARRGVNGYIADNEAYLVPNAPGNARRMFGPSTMGNFGQVLPFYAASEPKRFNQGLDILGESIQLCWFARPELNLRIVGSNITVPTTSIFGPQTPMGVGQTLHPPGK